MAGCLDCKRGGILLLGWKAQNEEEKGEWNRGEERRREERRELFAVVGGFA